MSKSKIFVDPSILDGITRSEVMGEDEKLEFLKYVGYMQPQELQLLQEII